MAKSKSTPEVVEEATVNVAETTETTETVVEETATVAEVAKPKVKAKEVAEVTVEVAKPKTVKVLALKDHECRVAGGFYAVQKNQEYNLPEDVATILATALIVMKK